MRRISSRKSLAILGGFAPVCASAGLVIQGDHPANLSEDPDLPSKPRTRARQRHNLADGPMVSPNAIRAVTIAGVHIGMPLDEALSTLKRTAVNVVTMPSPYHSIEDTKGKI